MAHYIALAASAVSILAPGLSKKDNNGSSLSSSSSSSSVGGTSSTSLGFSSGIVMGIGLGTLLVSQIQKRRIKERIRYSFLTWLHHHSNENNHNNNNSNNNNDELKESDSNSNTTNNIGNNSGNTNMEPCIYNLGEDSIMEIIANCHNSITPNLHCSKITLPKGTRTVVQESIGVEVYYVLCGTADFNFLNEDEDETGTENGTGTGIENGIENGTANRNASISRNESILVNPWTSRIISNNSNEDLVLLRMSDAGNDESSSHNANFVVEKIQNQMTMGTIAKGIKTSIQKLGSGITNLGSKEEK
jgi:hypothetical protein